MPNQTPTAAEAGTDSAGTLYEDQALVWRVLISSLGALGGITLLGVVVWSSRGGAPTLAVIGGSLLLVVASFLVGSLLGFLFGLPQRAQNPPAQEGAANAAGASPATTSARGERPTGFLASNNLTKVSDWLTTVIVGVGLVQATEVIAWIKTLGRDVAPLLLGGPPASEAATAAAAAAAIALLVSGFVAGLVAGYLVTSLILAGLMASAARRFEREQIERQVRKELQQHIEQEVRDESRALGEVRQIWRRKPIDSLLPGPDGTWPDEPSLTPEEERLAGASLADLGNDADLIRAWAKLQLARRRLTPATDGFRKLVKLRPEVAEFRAEFARVLAANGQTQEARREAEAARKAAAEPDRRAQVTPATRLSVAKAAAASALDEPSRRGFEEARRIIAEAEADLGDIATGDAELMLSKARALGQEHRDRKAAGAKEEDLEPLVRDAVEAVRRSLAARPDDKAWRSWLRQLGDRAYRLNVARGPTAKDDLETVFQASQELRDLLAADG
jgi:hypothetical protein